ncbi:hypothetical protein FAF44_44775 [Nonomuraea sp. MG754425]|uniref:hypothetical protein n=1 Tax=Nonomuraea sp. MG754425 TaxID=2570319 RepID=UPI001F283D1B|nr:hypothetical protein [Nonomuraea sp. MG754425]MCF6475422.1 hypothetical protein [Nonomuraea sp. MG754425]
MGFIRGFGQFWYDLIVGDDWKIAVAVVVTLAIGTVALLAFGVPALVLTPVLGVALMAAFAIALAIDVRGH